MKGPFGIVIGMAIVLLIVGVVFSLAPTVGGGIENAGDEQTRTETLTAASVYGATNYTYLSKNPAAHIVVASDAALTSVYDPINYTYSDTSGYVRNNVSSTRSWTNGSTIYVQYAYSSWDNDVNADIAEGGDFFAANETWVGLVFLGIAAAIVVGMFMRWG